MILNKYAASETPHYTTEPIIYTSTMFVKCFLKINLHIFAEKCVIYAYLMYICTVYAKNTLSEWKHTKNDRPSWEGRSQILLDY